MIHKGAEIAAHLDTEGALLHARHKAAHHRQRHVGFQQRSPNLAHRRLDVRLCQLAVDFDHVPRALHPCCDAVKERSCTHSAAFCSGRERGALQLAAAPALPCAWPLGRAPALAARGKQASDAQCARALCADTSAAGLRS